MSGTSRLGIRAESLARESVSVSHFIRRLLIVSVAEGEERQGVFRTEMIYTFMKGECPFARC